MPRSTSSTWSRWTVVSWTPDAGCGVASVTLIGVPQDDVRSAERILARIIERDPRFGGRTMRLGRQSGNVEDRRGMSPGMGMGGMRMMPVGGLGIGGLLLLLVLGY